MSAIKSNILRRMDSSLPGIHACCIKFMQRVIQTQTPGLIVDPRVSTAMTTKMYQHSDLTCCRIPRQTKSRSHWCPGTIQLFLPQTWKQRHKDFSTDC